MLRKFLKKFKYGQKGFTLIELLVVVAILGVLAAVAIPNVAKFIGRGQAEAKSTEISNIQTSVTAYMAETKLGLLPAAITFGNTGMASSAPYTGTNFPVDAAATDPSVGSYVVGGASKVAGSYTIGTDGSVDCVWYPGDAAIE